MLIWFAAAIALGCILLFLAVYLAFIRDYMDTFITVQFAVIIGVLLMLILAEGLHRPAFFDLAALLALLNFPAGLITSRILERWLP
jgi:multisubunit Na+/H+ antiporter MnhF subunit